jgi:membrane protease subunit (stomatin/prohibitin family)
MALFGNKDKPNTGGILNVIRCDEPSYLIWKWRPGGAEANSTVRENAIRWGSSLRVKTGEVAVFVYKQKDGKNEDYIEGPFDDTIKTANFPVLSSIVGAAFGGGSPFQAEIYFINLAGIIQIKFGVPYFDVFDPRFLDFAVPMSVRGTITFKIPDYKAFVGLHRLIDFDLESFKGQVKDATVKYVKGVVTNIPADNGIPVAQMERKLLEINNIVEGYIKPRFESDFGVTVSAVDISTVEPDKESEGWRSLMSVTKDIAAKTTVAQSDVNIKNMQDMQAINAENMAATLQAQREEAQYAQRMQTDSMNFNVHQLNQQTKVAVAGADAMGKMGEGGAMNMGAGGGMNPGAMMAGMAMGGAVGGQMAGMMGNMMQGMQQQPGMQPPGMAPPGMQQPGMAPPPPPVVQYNVAINGQTSGPFDMNALAQMVQSGQLTPQSQVWKQGMSGWAAAGTVQELSGLFAQNAPPPPPAP